MKKLFGLMLTVAFLMCAVPKETEAQRSYLISHNYSSAWGFKLDTAIGKGIEMIQIYDSVSAVWLSPSSAIVSDSCSSKVCTSDKDNGWITALLAHQKVSGNTFGVYPYSWYYSLVSASRINYPLRYTKCLLYYK